MGEPTLRGRRVAVEGVGKVGHHLVEHLLADGAAVVVSDVNEAALERARGLGATTCSVADLPGSDCDVYAPCALGGSLREEVVPRISAEVICGAANNQLATPGVAQALAQRGILFVPDYIANAGGLIQVGDEALHMDSGGFRFERARAAAGASTTPRWTSCGRRRRTASLRRSRPTGSPSGASRGAGARDLLLPGGAALAGPAAGR